MDKSEVHQDGATSYSARKGIGIEDLAQILGQRKPENQPSPKGQVVDNRTLPQAKVRLVNGKWRVFFEPGIMTKEGLALKSMDCKIEWDGPGTLHVSDEHSEYIALVEKHAPVKQVEAPKEPAFNYSAMCNRTYGDPEQ